MGNWQVEMGNGFNQGGDGGNFALTIAHFQSPIVTQGEKYRRVLPCETMGNWQLEMGNGFNQGGDGGNFALTIAHFQSPIVTQGKTIGGSYPARQWAIGRWKWAMGLIRVAMEEISH